MEAQLSNVACCLWLLDLKHLMAFSSLWCLESWWRGWKLQCYWTWWRGKLLLRVSMSSSCNQKYFFTYLEFFFLIFFVYFVEHLTLWILKVFHRCCGAICWLCCFAQILLWLSCSLWMRAARWVSCQSKWFRPRLEKCCRELMPPNPASWRPGLRWTRGTKAALCFYPLKFRLFLSLSLALGSQSHKLQPFLVMTWTRIPASVFIAPCLLLCLF